MVNPDNTLPPEQRLKSKRKIDNLFAKGKSGLVYPLRYVVLDEATDKSGEVSIMVSVPKKRHKRANTRNLIKRRVKEAYRINKHPLRDQVVEHNDNISLALMYISSDVLDYSNIENAIRKIIKELSKSY